MSTYLGENVDSNRLFQKLPSLLDEQEALKGAIAASVRSVEGVVVVTTQRVLHLRPNDYEMENFVYRSFIGATKRCQDSHLHRLDIEASAVSYDYVSKNAVDIMWLGRILSEHSISTTDEKVEDAVSIEPSTRHSTDSRVDRKVCDICKAETPADWNYCGKCGALLPKRDSENETSDLRQWSNCQKCGRQVDKQLKTCPYCGKKRTSGPNKAVPVVAAVIVALLVWGMLELDDWNEEFKTVDQALAYFKNPELFDEVPDVFGFHFENDLLHNYPYYGIDDWSLEVKERKEDLVFIQVYGTTINAYGAELERNPVFVLKNVSVLGYEIVDSYRFFVFDGELDESIRISDMVKHEMSER